MYPLLKCVYPRAPPKTKLAFDEYMMFSKWLNIGFVIIIIWLIAPGEVGDLQYGCLRDESSQTVSLYIKDGDFPEIYY